MDLQELNVELYTSLRLEFLSRGLRELDWRRKLCCAGLRVELDSRRRLLLGEELGLEAQLMLAFLEFDLISRDVPLLLLLDLMQSRQVVNPSPEPVARTLR